MKARPARIRGAALALAALWTSFLVSHCRPGGVAGAGQGPVVGVKIYEYAGEYPALFAAWDSLGINSAFVGPAVVSSPEFRRLARQHGVFTFIIFPVFFDAEALAADPGLFALTADGRRAEDDWVKFVCPTREDYRAAKVAGLRRLIEENDPDGISLDFIRHFVFWEKVYPDRTAGSLPNSCFDDACLGKFQAKTGIVIPGDLAGTAEKARWILAHHAAAWTEWKCGVITDMVGLLAAEARRIKPGIRINVHAVPWREGDFGGAIRTVAGQDLSAIAGLADIVSPMSYHHMVKRTPGWIHSVVEDAARRVRVPVLPSIQVKEAYLEESLSAAEFREALREALRPPSRGVVFWNWASLAESTEKSEAVRAVLGSRRRR